MPPGSHSQTSSTRGTRRRCKGRGYDIPRHAGHYQAGGTGPQEACIVLHESVTTEIGPPGAKRSAPKGDRSCPSDLGAGHSSRCVKGSLVHPSRCVKGSLVHPSRCVKGSLVHPSRYVMVSLVLPSRYAEPAKGTESKARVPEGRTRLERKELACAA
jgi:hypothetical protein